MQNNIIPLLQNVHSKLIWRIHHLKKGIFIVYMGVYFITEQVYIYLFFHCEYNRTKNFLKKKHPRRQMKAVKIIQLYTERFSSPIIHSLPVNPSLLSPLYNNGIYTYSFIKKDVFFNEVHSRVSPIPFPSPWQCLLLYRNNNCKS